jgi:hypothetical protein
MKLEKRIEELGEELDNLRAESEEAIKLKGLIDDLIFYFKNERMINFLDIAKNIKPMTEEELEEFEEGYRKGEW